MHTENCASVPSSEVLKNTHLFFCDT